MVFFEMIQAQFLVSQMLVSSKYINSIPVLVHDVCQVVMIVHFDNDFAVLLNGLL